MLLLQRLRQGRWAAIELPPEILGPPAHLPKKDVRLLLTIRTALAAHQACMFTSQHMCQFRILGAGTLKQPLQVLALPIKEWPVIPTGLLGWPSGHGWPVATPC